MGEFVALGWMAEVLRVVGDEGEARLCRSLRGNAIGVGFDQNRIIDRVALSMKRSGFVDGTLGRP